PGVAFENCLLLRVRTRQGFDFVSALPIAEHGWEIRSQKQMFTSDFAPLKVERLDVVDQRIEVEVFEINARHGSAVRGVRPVGATGILFAGKKFLIKAADVIGKKSPAMAGAEF